MTRPRGTHRRGAGQAPRRAPRSIELWQTEWCPSSHRVRQRLTELALSYVVRQVPVDPAARVELVTATRSTTIPVLVADGEVVRGEDAILDHLDRHFVEPPDALSQREKAARARYKELEEACPKLAATR